MYLQDPFNIGPIIGTYKSTVIQYFPATYFIMDYYNVKLFEFLCSCTEDLHDSTYWLQMPLNLSENI